MTCPQASPSPKRWVFLTAGFAMFSMFFGSGNLVFPLNIGFGTLDHFSFAAIGLLITGTLVPFLGLLTMIFMDGNANRFFAKLGKIPGFLLPLFMLAILGPFGVCARCILVSYGSLELVFPSLSFSVFSISFALVSALLTLNRKRIVRILARYLTPFLLLGIIMILMVGIFYAPHPGPSLVTTRGAFHIGLHQGYQTMDLLAAFFFSITIVEYLRAHMGKGAPVGEVAREAIKASGVGITLLALVYLGFVSLGAAYADVLQGVSPESMLIHIAQNTLGNIALPVVALTITTACLTTLIALAGLFADFCHKEMLREKIPRSVCVIITYALCSLVSFLGFEHLARLMGTLLEVIYPALIFLSFFAIMDHFTGKNWAPKAFYLALFGAAACRAFNACFF